MANVLIIDDDPKMCKVLMKLIARMGHEATSRGSLDSGLDEARSRPYDIVFLDVNFPEGSGLDILPKIRKTAAKPDVIIMTAFGDATGAEMAIKYGAWDYIQKSVSPKELTLPLKRIIQYREGLEKIRQSAVALKLDDIVGSSSQMKACYDFVAKAANSSANVLITGETGTGKELFSRAIHANSLRSASRFVVVDCAALPETLVESVLFGHVKGAFTGADTRQEGLVKHADGGTLFLDEVGELPFAVQKTFLRVLQERCFRPVGSKDELKSDFRLIAATNRNLEQMVHSGRFREDLLFRLQELSIDLPCLRDRPEDIIDIALFHTRRLCEQHRMGTKGFSPEFFELLRDYEWPGNVRELINALKSVLTAAVNESTLLPIHMPMQIRIHSVRSSLEIQDRSKAESEKTNQYEPVASTFREAIESTEQKYIQNLISETKGDIKDACRISGLSRSRLYGLMKKHNISRKS
jgi:two-component system NtrC family response regulator